jgi:type I restriction enzyme S subunit
MLIKKTTAVILNISLDDIAQIAIPVPPKSEMHIAIEAIRMNTGSASEETNVIDYSTRAVAAIRQSLLKAAFEGQLVEQNPKDEPADVLLGRLSGAAIGSLTTRSAPRSSVVTLAVK